MLRSSKKVLKVKTWLATKGVYSVKLLVFLLSNNEKFAKRVCDVKLCDFNVEILQ